MNRAAQPALVVLFFNTFAILPYDSKRQLHLNVSLLVCMTPKTLANLRRKGKNLTGARRSQFPAPQEVPGRVNTSYFVLFPPLGAGLGGDRRFVLLVALKKTTLRSEETEASAAFWGPVLNTQPEGHYLGL